MSEDKLEVGQVREWVDCNKSQLRVDYIGKTRVIYTWIKNDQEGSKFTSLILKFSTPVKTESKEIKVKWYKTSIGSIFCNEATNERSKHWIEIDFIDGKFYEK